MNTKTTKKTSKKRKSARKRVSRKALTRIKAYCENFLAEGRTPETERLKGEALCEQGERIFTMGIGALARSKMLEMHSKFLKDGTYAKLKIK